MKYSEIRFPCSSCGTFKAPDKVSFRSDKMMLFEYECPACGTVTEFETSFDEILKTCLKADEEKLESDPQENIEDYPSVVH